MNFITFGFSEKGSPIFLNQEPYQQVGTMYLMKAGDNSVIGITLDDKAFKINKRSNEAAARKPRKAKAAEAVGTPRKRGPKPKQAAEATAAPAPKKGGRKPGPKKQKAKKKVEAPPSEALAIK